jgi:site-specific DNA-cytosine methylase
VIGSISFDEVGRKSCQRVFLIVRLLSFSFLNGSFASKKPKTKSFTKQAYTEGEDLEIISHPQAMFDDMVNRVGRSSNKKSLLALLKAVQDRPIRVATMCSGTESPVLALDMLANSMEAFLQENEDGASLSTLQIEHVFSCEIEPFKQAYIERNFQPPLLFRDIRELGKTYASTAYGSLAKVPNVPGCVDLLIAGTSCVDYSNLNNQQKTIDQQGESGQTFRGMMDWIAAAKPPLVILENVKGAPWQTKVDWLGKIGYDAVFEFLDTKRYYIPHTRQRGYLLAVRRPPASFSSSDGKPKKKKQKHQSLVEWQNLLKRMKRPASATLDAFMLPNDDPRVARGRARMTNTNGSSSASSVNAVDWVKCEGRHQLARSTEELGDKRPLTGKLIMLNSLRIPRQILLTSAIFPNLSGWSETGNTRMPGFAWNEWTNQQVHRIHDLMDINTLRLAKTGIDPTYKTMVWNLSQNVDRDTMGKLGLSQCLTPTMVPYVTNRGGPLVGEELLLLQGIPADDLVLTKEAKDQLKDLAGNAMSTTVVGACLLAALLLYHDHLPDRKGNINATSTATVVPTLIPRPLAPATRTLLLPEIWETTKHLRCACRP